MPNRSSLATLLAVLVVSLALTGPVLAKPFGPPPPDPPEPPAAVEGVYVTSEDNQNNAGTGSPDNDMGCAPPFWVCTGGQTEPVEFNIEVDADICSGGELGLAVFDFEAGMHQVYLNGDLLGTLPDVAGVWAKVLFQVPQSSLVEQGTNLVKIDLGGEDCGSVAWGAIAVEPCEEEFVPEPGTMLLLGSGLAGLAGYATLRLRSRQAPR
ncbi:MAG: PEP-CTERM sorting domain-containing protein [Anaerolineae bacterium]